MKKRMSYWNSVEVFCPIDVIISYYDTSSKTTINIDNFEDFEVFIELMILFRTFIETNPKCSMKLAYDIFKMINDNEDIPELKQFALSGNGMWRHINPMDANNVMIAYRYEDLERIYSLNKLLCNIYVDILSGKITYT